MPHICLSKLTTTGRHQAIICTNAGILLIPNIGTNFSEIVSKIRTFLFKKIQLKMSSAKWQQVCLGPNVLRMFNNASSVWVSWELNPLTTSLFIQQVVEVNKNLHQSSTLLVLCERNPLETNRFLSHKANDVVSFPCHYITMCRSECFKPYTWSVIAQSPNSGCKAVEATGWLHIKSCYTYVCKMFIDANHDAFHNTQRSITIYTVEVYSKTMPDMSCDFVHWSAPPHSLWDSFCVCCSGVECHNMFLSLIPW